MQQSGTKTKSKYEANSVNSSNSAHTRTIRLHARGATAECELYFDHRRPMYTGCRRHTRQDNQAPFTIMK